MHSRKWLMAGAAAILFLAQTAMAQAPGPQPVRRPFPPPGGPVVLHAGEDVLVGGPQSMPPMMGVRIGDGMSLDSKVVKDAPYSAEAVTETIEILTDGNRIIRKNSSQLYRDAQGRTRREDHLGAVGPWATGEAKTMIFINDPVAGVNYVLDPETKTARKMDVSRRVEQSASGPDGAVEFNVEVEKAEASGPDRMVFIQRGVATSTGTGHVMEHKVLEGNQKTESLGKQTTRGLEGGGTGTKRTVPAGAVGNERAIEILTERWHSPALGQDVLRKHTDPHFGETTYRLTKIIRSEPMASLFELPSDYTVKEAGTIQILRRKIETVERKPKQP